jgi:hypothetical protein
MNMQDQCPFCKSVNLMPIHNSVNKHWLLCTDCRASGPQCDSAEEALAAFKNVTVPRKPGVIARLLGRE